ncbi:hypothetical protein C5167_001457, partial [Papaver somniferum]
LFFFFSDRDKSSKPETSSKSWTFLSSRNTSKSTLKWSETTLRAEDNASFVHIHFILQSPISFFSNKVLMKPALRPNLIGSFPNSLVSGRNYAATNTRSE